jgi:SAM-dependent methyltransferase
MNVKLFAQKIVRSVRDDGIPASIRKAPQYLRRSRTDADDFDARNGTDTGGFEHIWKFHIRSDNARFGTHYRATSERDLTKAVNSLGEDVRGFTFVDLGCGKGKTLMVASRLGFRRVIGVEFASELAAIARANLVAVGIDNAVVIEGDAAVFDFPDDSLVLYLYNPFSREVMNQVIENLGKSRGAKMYVIYKNPTYADSVLDSSGFLQRHGRLVTESNIQVWRRVEHPRTA